MDNKDQRSVLKARLAVLTIIDRPEGTLDSRLIKAKLPIQILAAAISIWMDNTAVSYVAQGYEQSDFREDVLAWFSSKQFYIDHDVQDPDMIRCHLSNVGWGRHVIMSFKLGSTNPKGTL
jgi:hypothetical protein